MASHGLLENFLAKMRSETVLLTSAGFGQIFCGMCSNGFGIWSCWMAQKEFRLSLGSNVWAGVDYIICGCCCLIASGSRLRKMIFFSCFLNLVSLILSLSLLTWSFVSSLEPTSFLDFNSTVFHVGWLTVSSMAMLFCAAGLKFSRDKYVHQFMVQNCSGEQASQSGLHARRVTSLYPADSTSINVLQRLPPVYSFTNESFIIPPPEEGAPPPYSEFPSLGSSRHLPSTLRHTLHSVGRSNSQRCPGSGSQSIGDEGNHSSTRQDPISPRPPSACSESSTSARTVVVERLASCNATGSERGVSTAVAIDEALVTEVYLNVANLVQVPIRTAILPCEGGRTTPERSFLSSEHRQGRLLPQLPCLLDDAQANTCL